MAWSEILSDADTPVAHRPMREDGSPITDKQQAFLMSMAANIIHWSPAEDPELDLDMIGSELRDLLATGTVTKAQASQLISVLKPLHETLRRAHGPATLRRTMADMTTPRRTPS